jgi:hypothetical protein
MRAIKGEISLVPPITHKAKGRKIRLARRVGPGADRLTPAAKEPR